MADSLRKAEALVLLLFWVHPLACAGSGGGMAIRTPEIVVARDGSGTFQTVQQAFDAVPNRSDQWTVIRVKSGRYREKIVLRPEEGRNGSCGTACGGGIEGLSRPPRGAERCLRVHVPGCLGF